MPPKKKPAALSFAAGLSLAVYLRNDRDDQFLKLLIGSPPPLSPSLAGVHHYRQLLAPISYSLSKINRAPFQVLAMTMPKVLVLRHAQLNLEELVRKAKETAVLLGKEQACQEQYQQAT